MRASTSLLKMEGMRGTREVLEDGSVHLWQTDVLAASDRDLLSSYERLLSKEESARHRRFLRERDRDLFLVAHALVRTTLSRYCPVSPGAWEFEMGERGRPEIAGPVDAGLRFNLSHTPGRAVCAVARDRDVGVDVERLSRVTQPLLIADRFFAPAEIAALRASHESQRRQRFFELWTLKESYIKARGLGLAIPLDQFLVRRAGPRADRDLVLAGAGRRSTGLAVPNRRAWPRVCSGRGCPADRPDFLSLEHDDPSAQSAPIVERRRSGRPIEARR